MTLEERVERLCRNRGVTPPFRQAILQAFESVRRDAMLDVANAILEKAGIEERLTMVQMDQVVFDLQVDTPLVGEGNA